VISDRDQIEIRSSRTVDYLLRIVAFPVNVEIYFIPAVADWRSGNNRL
jgi:hypothetical protein